jgi:hypothetical protein
VIAYGRRLARLACLSGALLLVPADRAAPAEEGKVLRLVSGYPVTTAGGGRSVALTVTFKGDFGEGTLALDPNARGLNDFGDPTSTTLIAFKTYSVKLERLRAEDPTGQGRHLYALGGEGLPGTYKLVVPTKAGGAYRLVYRGKDGKGGNSVVVLEPAPPAKKKK